MTTCRFFNKKLKREIGNLQDALTDTKFVIFNVIIKEIGEFWDTFTEIKFFESKK